MKYRINKSMYAAWDLLKQEHIMSHAKIQPRQLNKSEKMLAAAHVLWTSH